MLPLRIFWNSGLPNFGKRRPSLIWLIGIQAFGLGIGFPGHPSRTGARKTGWMRAEAAGDVGPWRQQAVLGRSHWDADALRDVVRDYALETLAEGDAVRVIDETGFLKQGTASCGVGRQYTGSAGKITNCQVGVFAAYVSTKGHAFIDRQLYLPKAWTDNPERRAGPMCLRMSSSRPSRTSRSDDPAGDRRRGALRLGGGGQCLRRRRGRDGVAPGWQGIRARCRGHAQFNSWDKPEPVAGTAEAIAAALPASRWLRRSAGAGTKGPRLYDWGYLELADLDARAFFDCGSA